MITDLQDFECSFPKNLEQKFSDLKFKISDELFEKIASVVVFIVVVAFNNQLLGIIVAVTTLVGTFIMSINVNSTDWRAQIADGIYETIVKKQNQYFNEVSHTVTDFKRRLGQTGQKPCKYNCLTIY